MANSKTYQAWADMKSRCDNVNHKKYPAYGALDINYAPSWKTFVGFYTDMGEAPAGTSLDRIKNELGYFKENCRWISKLKSNLNTSRILLNERKVILLRALLNSVKPGIKKAEAYRVFADVFSVSPGVIRAIADRRTWWHI